MAPAGSATRSSRRAMPKSRPTSATARPVRPSVHPRPTLSTARSGRSWRRSNSSASAKRRSSGAEAARLDPILAELRQDRLRRLRGQLHAEFGELDRAAYQSVQTAAGEAGIDLDRIGKGLYTEHLGSRARGRFDTRKCEPRHLDAQCIEALRQRGLRLRQRCKGVVTEM